MTAATVILLTLLFDLVDLWPTVGSFRFVWGWAYLVYFLFRCTVFLVAAALIASSQPDLSPILVGYFAVLGGVALVHGFGLKVADQELVNLGNLIETFKDKFKAQESKRAAEARQAELLTLTSQLAHASEEFLEQAYLRLELQATGGEGQHVAAAVREKVAEIQRTVEASAARREVYAAQIVQQNGEYARDLVKALPDDSKVP